jgi:hypothetical protein
MPIEKTSAIDAVHIDKLSGALHLTIADHLEWDDDHLFKLQDKINSCLSFIESGEVFSAYPDAKDRDFVIDVVLKYRPTADASAFFEQAAPIIENAGILFRYGPGPTGYIDGNG